MSKVQTAIWTALPNGVENGKLRLSVFVAPRLQTDEGGAEPKLDQFPDFLEWPARMAAATFQVKFGNQPPVAATRVEPAGLAGGADLYRAVLNASTYIEPFNFPKNLTARNIRSFPMRNVLTHLKNVYQQTSLRYPTVIPQVGPTAPQAEAQPMLGILGQLAPPAAQKTALRTQLNQQLRSAPTKALFNPVADDTTAFKPTPTGSAPPVSAAVVKAEGPSLSADFQQFEMFYNPVPRPPRVERPHIPVKRLSIDFHKIISSLGQYPGVLRLLSLVIDLEVPYDAALQGTTTVSVIPSWTPATTTNKPPLPQTTNTMPRTRCVIGPNQFAAQPKPDSDIGNGLLKLDDESRFAVGQVDVDGAAIKAITAAEQAQTGTGDEEKNAALPSLRSVGIWVAHLNRAHRLATLVLPRLVALNDAVDKEKQPDDLYAEDIVRGYRVDVLDEAAGQWRSLCQRLGEYHFRNTDESVNKKVNLEDEGWISSATTESTEEGDDDLYVHESLFTWDGWSVAAPRPMRPLPNPETPKAKLAEYGLDTTLTPKPSSLPRLRFGHSYRLRARVVDLAGNSLPPDLADASAASDPVEYVRHECVATPILVPRTDMAKSPGESLERMVIRTFNDTPAKDKQPSPEGTERHVAPPKSSESMAEWHGKFDSDQGMKGDAATYQLIIDNDGSLKDVEQADQLELPYLPDPLAIGATIRSVQIDVAPGPEDEIVKIPYEGDWPDVQPFRIRIVEERGDGGTGPDFQKAQRRLVIPLPKAEIAEIWVSSYLDEPVLADMGVYRWTIDKLAAPAVRKASLQGPQLRQVRRQLYTPRQADAAAKTVSLEAPKLQQVQLISAVATKGLHWMLTPYRKVLLVHAVQQPLITPDVSGLKAVKKMGNTYATLEDKLPISGKSTLKVDVLAEWEEPIDPLSESTWRTMPGKTHVVELPVQYGDTEIVMGTPTELPRADLTRPIAAGPVSVHPAAKAKMVPVASKDLALGALGVPLVQKVEPGAAPLRLAPRMLMLAVMGPRHEFGDTKYRRVTYKAIAATRFREYFEEAIASDEAKITRTSKPVTVDVLNSARPLPPKVRYVIPTFGWETETAADGMTSKRSGGGLRVYLERPWFSSGDGELLGVVLPSKQTSVAATAVRALVGGGGVAEALKRYVTQTGADPIHRSASVKPAPDPSDFPLATESEDDLTLEELPGAKVQVVGHKVQFDPNRQLWFCDIQINPQFAYYPFVRLALVRYQPRSIKNAKEDCKLSKVVVADFAQLAPDRTAAVSFDAAGRLANVNVMGVAAGTQMEATLETRQPGVQGALGWVPVPDSTVELADKPINDRLTSWTGRLPVPGAQPPERFRVVVKEYERYRVDQAPTGAPAPTAMVANIPTDRRLVYADVLRLGRPAGPAEEEEG